MKKTKISLKAMLKLLDEYEHFPTPEVAFNALLYRWRVVNGHTTEWLYNVRKRDLISFHLAKDFAQFCLDKDWQKMMPN